MYNDNKHQNDWNRRRPDFPRDDRYRGRDNYSYQSYSPTKRRKLENGEAEPILYENQRRGYPVPTPYNNPRRTPTQRNYYSRDNGYEQGRYNKNTFYPPQRDFSRQYPTSFMRKPSYNMEHIPNEQRQPDYREKYPPYEPPIVGKKRLRPDMSQNSRFIPRREYEQRTISSLPHLNNLPPNTKIISQDHRVYSPTVQSPNLNVSTPPPSTTPSEPKSPDKPIITTPSSDAEEEITLSKIQIIEEMDKYDTEISNAEEEIEKYKQLKTKCQRNTDKSKLSFIDKILVTNQEIADNNIDFIKLFQKIDVTTKTKPNKVFTPDNIETHKLKKPAMIQYMKKSLLHVKEKNKKLVEEYQGKWKKWRVKILRDHIQSPKPVAEYANALPIQVPTEPVVPPKGRKSRNSTNVRTELELAQLAEQLSESDPNTRYLKTLAKIPPLIFDNREKQRSFIDNNRFIEDCTTEYNAFKLTNPWTPEEQNIFIKKYTIYPKQFGKIASFLPNKSIEEVIRFYFLNKHRLNLKGLLQQQIQAKKRPRARSRKQNVSSSQFQNKDSAESNHDSNYWIISSTTKERVTRSRVQRNLNSNKPIKERPVRTKQTQKTKKVKSIPTTPTKKYRPVQAVGAVQLCFCNNAPTSWSEVEIALFKNALKVYNTDFKAIADYISTKNHWQCRSFYFNFTKQLQLEGVYPKRNIKLSSNSIDSISFDDSSKSLELSSVESIQNDNTNDNNSALSSLLSATNNETSDNLTSKNWTLDIPSSNNTKSDNYRSSFLPLSTNTIPPVVLYSEESRKALRNSVSNFPSMVKNTSQPNITLSRSIDSLSPLENINTSNSVDWKMDNNIQNPSISSSSNNYSSSDNIPSTTIKFNLKSPIKENKEENIKSSTSSSNINSPSITQPQIMKTPSITQPQILQNSKELTKEISNISNTIIEKEKPSIISTTPKIESYSSNISKFTPTSLQTQSDTNSPSICTNSSVENESLKSLNNSTSLYVEENKQSLDNIKPLDNTKSPIIESPTKPSIESAIEPSIKPSIESPIKSSIESPTKPLIESSFPQLSKPSTDSIKKSSVQPSIESVITTPPKDDKKVVMPINNTLVNPIISTNNTNMPKSVFTTTIDSGFQPVNAMKSNIPLNSFTSRATPVDIERSSFSKTIKEINLAKLLEQNNLSQSNIPGIISPPMQITHVNNSIHENNGILQDDNFQEQMLESGTVIPQPMDICHFDSNSIALTPSVPLVLNTNISQTSSLDNNKDIIMKDSKNINPFPIKDNSINDNNISTIEDPLLQENNQILNNNNNTDLITKQQSIENNDSDSDDMTLHIMEDDISE